MTQNIFDKLKDIEFSYTDDGEVEFLISPNYGAGWYTWNDYDPRLIFDKRIIDFLRKVQAEEDAYFSTDGDNCDSFYHDLNERIYEFFRGLGYHILGDSEVLDETEHALYLGGFFTCVVKSLPKGTKFLIKEYDGSESVVICRDDDYIQL